MSDIPTARPGEISIFPKLNIRYRTDPARVAALLPPGINPVDSPYVYLGVYCVPIRNEPEYGVSTKVDAEWNGIVGQYSLGIGIDQEAAIEPHRLKTVGMEALARRASGKKPWRRATASPVSMSVATQTNGIGNWLKSGTWCTGQVRRDSNMAMFCPEFRPEGNCSPPLFR